VDRDGARFLRLTGTAIGDITIELDTALTELGHGAAVDALLDAARQVVPVEIVTEPLTPQQVAQLDEICPILRRAGARGSRDGVLYGFGVHLNVEIPGRDTPHLARIIRAYGLLEPVLRDRMALDGTRRLLPFVRPWPVALVRDLIAAGDEAGLGTIAALYANHTQSRNHGLDLLPLLKWADGDRYSDLFGNAKSGARPAFHFRLPESRIDEAHWSLTQPWAQWLVVEQVADHLPTLNALSGAWDRQSTPDYIAQAAGILDNLHIRTEA